MAQSRFASERDFVANFLLPNFKEAAGLLTMADVIDFHVEKAIDGIPDLMAERGGKGLFVIEAKFVKKVAKIKRDIEPRDPEVIIQAFNYAGTGGFPYYATCNTKRLILFKLRPGIKMLESEVASFDFERDSDWAERFLKTVLELVPVSLKPPDDILVDTFHEAFNDLYPEFLKSLNERLRDEEFRKKYVGWLENQGIKFTDETNRLIAEQTTYLQLNKLLFYQIIKAIYPENLKPLRVGEEEDVSETLSDFFQNAIKIGYSSIYQSDIISEIPFTARAKERIRTLLDTLNEFDFSIMESDFIGRIYEKLIPPLERKRLGQFYTPPYIVDFIVQLTITKPDAKVFDPGCGSGSFLVRAYHKLAELNKLPKGTLEGLYEVFHRKLLERLYGIDINQFPTHLTVINLVVQNPKAKIERVNAVVRDFFEVKPGQTISSGFEEISTEQIQLQIEMPPTFDAVVANPPYIRQEFLGENEKLKIKTLIEDEYKDKLFIGALSKKAEGPIVLDRQSDIYIYFYIHGLAFLKNGGKLGFISSNKWLEVGYGVPFQQFLLDNTKILYVVEFDRTLFPDAEVDTAVTILEKEPRKEARQNNLIKFVRVKQRLDMGELLERIQKATESHEDAKLKINVIKQERLVPGKWNVYLRAPPVYSKILSNPKVKPLKSLAKVFRGPTTGYNAYFIISKEKAREQGIERKFLSPCISSPKDVRSLVIRKDDLNEYFFMVHEEKHKLEGTAALNYIEYGEKLDVEVIRGSKRERRKLPQLETVKNRNPFWYSLPIFKTPHILFPKLSRERFVVFYNMADAQASDVFYYVIVDVSKGAEIVAGYLNSSVAMLLAELYGRQYTGMLDLKVYEVEQLPVIDPSMLTDTERDRIISAFRNLIKIVDNRVKAEVEFKGIKARKKETLGLFELEVKKKLDEERDAEMTARKQLDEAVCDALGLSRQDIFQIEKGLRELQELRRLRTK